MLNINYRYLSERVKCLSPFVTSYFVESKVYKCFLTPVNATPSHIRPLFLFFFAPLASFSYLYRCSPPLCRQFLRQVAFCAHESSKTLKIIFLFLPLVLNYDLKREIRKSTRFTLISFYASFMFSK